MKVNRALTKLRGIHGKRIITNPDGSVNCLKRVGKRWEVELVEVSREVGLEFFAGTLGPIIEA